jgi:hypothetical protein
MALDGKDTCMDFVEIIIGPAGHSYLSGIFTTLSAYLKTPSAHRHFNGV